MNLENTPARHVRTVLPLSALALLVTGAVLYAGPLNPPSGAVSSTYKTLTEVEPRIAINATNTPGDADATPSRFKITAPGSYYLTANVDVPTGKIGIEIAASPVTIDLSGFEVRGAGSADGISTTLSFGGGALVIRNGSVLNCANGINTNQTNTLIEGIEATGNSGSGIIGINSTTVAHCTVSFGTIGIVVNGNCQVFDCTVQEASVAGISAGSGSTVTNCSAFANNDGIRLTTGTGGTITGCTAFQNSGSGIVAGVGSTITNSSVSSNGGDGIRTAGLCTFTGCTAFQNSGSGFDAGSGSTVTGCASSRNDGDGISAGTGCTITGCKASQNTGSGILAGSGSAITGCSANTNHAVGLNVAFYCSALDCNASSNGLDGILAAQGCLLRGNTCNGNGTDAAGGAGIHVIATDCRLEGNVCNQNDRGVDIDFSGNIVVRNTCAGNTTDWEIVANNVVGPILDRRAPASAAISGFSAPDSTGSNHPNANFSY